jgi:glycosyltransferase involved in cell wall biosynthesis
VVWNIRQSIAALEDEKPLTARLIRLGARMSAGPAGILYNSATAREQHEALGYQRAKSEVIANGFELTRFRPDPDARTALRAQLGLRPDTHLIGLVARYHPMKDHAGFLRAAALVKMQHPGAHFVLVGRGVTNEASALREQVSSLGLSQCVHLLGEREDVAFITAALDIAVNASWRGEGFSNAIGEAMACAVPCVVTDVGDSAWIVGPTGRVVPAQDEQAMAQAIADLLDAGPSMRTALGQAARARMIDMFDLARVSARYQDLYEELCGSGRR